MTDFFQHSLKFCIKVSIYQMQNSLPLGTQVPPLLMLQNQEKELYLGLIFPKLRGLFSTLHFWKNSLPMRLLHCLLAYMLW